MKRSILLLLLGLSINTTIAQNLGLNNDGSLPDPSAMLDVKSTDKGILIPRVDIADLSTEAPVIAPADGLMVYNENTTTGVGFYYWNGSEWQMLNTTFERSGEVVRNAGDHATEDFVFGSPQLNNSGNQDFNNRFFFAKSTGAFRAGNTNGSAWNEANLGTFSVAFGANTLASGFISTAFGNGTAALGSGSTAFGVSTSATGSRSTAFGLNTNAESYLETVIGSFDENYNPLSTNTFNNNDRLFVIGNGIDDANRSNALTILKNGNTGIGNSNPGTLLNVSGSKPGSFLVEMENLNSATAKVLSLKSAALGDADIFDIQDGLFVVEGDGDVGIGTIDPISELDVNGKITMQNGAVNGYIPVSDANGTMTWNDPNTIVTAPDGDGDATNELSNLSLNNNILALSNPLTGGNQVNLSSYSSKWGMAANDIYFQTGNVGIGTSMPGSLLEVAGIKKDILNIKTLDNAKSQGIAFQRSGANYNWNIFRNAQNSDALTFAGGNTDLASLSELVTIMTDGKVGIGTNTPDVELSIAGRIRSAFDAAETSYVEIGHEGSKSFIKNVGGSKLDFLSNGNQLLMSLNSTGNLSIGSGGSTNKLDVSGEMAIGPNYAGIESAPTRGLIVEGNVGIGVPNPSAQFEVEDNASSGYVASISNSNSSNAQTLFINSKNNATGNALVVQGNAGKNTGTLWTVTSDRRLKTDIKPYQGGLEELLKVNPVTFHYNEKSGNPTEEEHVGVIAQELQQIAPYMVEEFEKNGETYLNVNASPMIFMFVNAIQEQQEMIEELQHENISLKANASECSNKQDLLENKLDKLLHRISSMEDLLTTIQSKKEPIVDGSSK